MRSASVDLPIRRPKKIVTGWYDYRLVALSVFIAICASYAAFDLAARITATRGTARIGWLASGATAMGTGIWSMHYVGMLAFKLPIPVLYDLPTVLLSLAAAIFAAAVALFVVARRVLGWRAALTGGVVMGSGIATMHYTGMAAMRLSAVWRYDGTLVTLSVLFAIAISLAAIWLTFHFRGDVRRPFLSKLGSAVVMGSAIPVMHYTAMAAAGFMPTSHSPGMSHSVSTWTLGLAGVSAVTFLMLGAAIATAAVDRRLSAHRSELEASEKKYEVLVQGVKDYAIFLLTPDGQVASWNMGAERIKGYAAEEIIGQDFARFYTEEDIARGMPAEQLAKAKQEGRAEEQGWRVRKDGSRFWADVVITPLYDSAGKLEGFSKVVRDVTERREAEENLRELSARLLQAQDEERRRIARELHDSAGQLITGVSLNLGALERVERSDSKAFELITETKELVDELLKEVRSISYLLHPPILDEVGLVAALRIYVDGFAQRSNIQVSLDVSSDFGRMPREAELTIFRVVQECLTNIHRHSGSPTASIRVARAEGEVRVEVADEGKGIAAEKQAASGAGIGIRGMRERVRLLGGSFEITSTGQGTTVRIVVPLWPNDDGAAA